MPKERRNRSASFEARSHPLPFPCSSSSHHRGSSSSSSRNPSETRNPPQSPTAAAKDVKDWDAIRCSVCMEHPHNAVLLVCSSSNNGCQPFMCDTSYRHSNCLDQYQKVFSASSSSLLPQENEADKQPTKLSCPLCRGEVTGWTVVEPARLYMNSKHRNCSLESCGFTGAYGDLRKHARVEHPSVRPFKADPERERDWRRMEQQRDIGDLVSTMQSAMGGGEDGALGGLGDDEDDPASSNNPFQTIHVIFVFRVSGTGGGMGTGRTSVRYSRARSSRSRQGRATILWGETFNEPEPAVIVNSSAGGGADDEDAVDNWGSDEMPRQTRTRRQLRLLDDDDDEDINFDNDDLLDEE